MSTFSVPVVKLGKVGKHPNADSLSITTIEGCPVIFKTGEFREGDTAIYVPVDAVVPETVPGTEFLGKYRRIKAKRLRGIFSMGLLLPETTLPKLYGESGRPAPFFFWGQDVSNLLGITKYEEPLPMGMMTDIASPPKLKTMPPVYDIESYRKYKSVLIPGEMVYVSEKLHGTNSRFVVDENGELHVGSHKQWKKEDDRCLWWRVAQAYNLHQRLQPYPGYVLYGETYGQVQDLKYGAKLNEIFLAVFDVFNSNTGKWMSPAEFIVFADEVGLPRVPMLYMGAYSPDVVEPLANGHSTLADHIREGIVIKPFCERWDSAIGRVALKLVSEDYLLRKGGTEMH